MKKNGSFKELIDQIHSFPEPDYEKDFNSEKQKQIHDNLMNFAREHDKKKRKSSMKRRITVGLAGVAAMALVTIMFLSIGNLNKHNASDTGNQTKELNQEVVKDNLEESDQQVIEQSEGQLTTVNFNEAQYQDIAKIYNNYEPPMEGSGVDYIDEEYDVIIYNNGISIIQETKSIADWPIDEEGTRITPTRNQILAAIKGNIEELRDKIKSTKDPFGIDYPKEINHKLEDLYRLQSYADSYEPIVAWMNVTIRYFEESKRLLNDEPEEAKALYEKGMDNIKKFTYVLEDK